MTNAYHGGSVAKQLQLTGSLHGLSISSFGSWKLKSYQGLQSTQILSLFASALCFIISKPFRHERGSQQPLALFKYNWSTLDYTAENFIHAWQRHTLNLF